MLCIMYKSKNHYVNPVAPRNIACVGGTVAVSIMYFLRLDDQRAL